MSGMGGAHRGLRRRGLAGLAAGGVMAGHWVAYAIREPDAGARAVLLEATGHHLLPQLSLVALLAALIALVGVPRAGHAAGTSYGRVAAALVALQAGGFTALETGERLLAHGHGLSLEHLADPAMGIGLAAQVAIGCAAAALVVGLSRLAPRATASPALAHVPFLPAQAPAACRSSDRPGDAAHSLRGPPLPSRA